MSLSGDFSAADLALAAMTKTTQRNLIRAYAQAMRNVQGELADYARRYTAAGKLTYAEAMKYNRLVALERNVNAELRRLGVRVATITRRDLGDLFSEAYYRTGWAVSKAVAMQYGGLLRFGLLSPRVIEAAVQLPLSGLTLNDRLTRNRADVVWRIKQEITQGLIRGDGYAPMAREVRKVLENDAVKATRVVQTEAHRAQNQGRYEAMGEVEEQGVKLMSVWDATLDEHTRASHGEMDGQTVPYGEEFTAPGGATALYPGGFGVAEEDINCRCRLRTEIADLKPELRRIRGEGIVEYQTYKQWRPELE